MGCSFGMRDDIEDDVGVVHDDEVKSPIPIDPRLPHIMSLVVLFGVQRGMLKIHGEKRDLLVKRSLDVGGCIFECSSNPWALIIELHRARGLRWGRDILRRSRLSEATISAAVSNGPAVWPFFTPSSANFSRASMTRRCAGVYSSSADGSLGTMLMTLPDTLNSTRSPVLIPARSEEHTSELQ